MDESYFAEIALPLFQNYWTFRSIVVIANKGVDIWAILFDFQVVAEARLAWDDGGGLISHQILSKIRAKPDVLHEL